MIWKSRIPLKIKFFLWQVFRNKLQVAGNLVKRGWKGDIDCCLCDCPEHINHLLLNCHLAKLTWGIICSVFGLGSCPSSIDDLLGSWLQGMGPLPSKLVLFLFAGYAWMPWITRNKMVIEKVFPKAPTDVIYNAISLMQRWCTLLKEKDRERITQVLEVILSWLKNFRPNSTSATDVFEL